jgi:hypothetical protein
MVTGFNQIAATVTQMDVKSVADGCNVLAVVILPIS